MSEPHAESESEKIQFLAVLDKIGPPDRRNGGRTYMELISRAKPAKVFGFIEQIPLRAGTK